MRTQQHVRLLALAQLEIGLRKQHQRLQGLDGGLINVELQARAACILLADSDGRIVSAEMGCISGYGELIGDTKVM